MRRLAEAVYSANPLEGHGDEVLWARHRQWVFTSSKLMTASFSVGWNLMAVSAKEHATPPATMGLRLIAEPEHASLVLQRFTRLKSAVANRMAAASATGAKTASSVSSCCIRSMVSERGFFHTSRGRL